MIINLKSLSLLAPVFVSFFWASILFLRNRSIRRPGFYMALMMMVIFFIFLSIVPYYNGNILLYAILDPLFFGSILSLFPLVFFYIRTITLRKNFVTRDWMHFIPAIFFIITSIVLHLFLSEEERIAYAFHDSLFTGEHPHLSWITAMNTFAKVFAVFQMVLYFLRSRMLIRDYRQRIEDYFSTIERYFFHWIPFFYFAYALSAITGAILLILGNAELDNGKNEIMIFSFIFLSTVFFTIGYIANHQRYIENGQFYLPDIEDKVITDENNKKIHPFPEGLKEKLETFFEQEKPYLDPDLKITDLARELNTNRTYISQVIKTYYGTNFNGYINTCRIRECILLFKDRNHQHYTTKSISELAGFNNYNSFAKAFRDEMGMTPGRYREGGDLPRHSA